MRSWQFWHGVKDGADVTGRSSSEMRAQINSRAKPLVHTVRTITAMISASRYLDAMRFAALHAHVHDHVSMTGTSGEDRRCGTTTTRGRGRSEAEADLSFLS